MNASRARIYLQRYKIEKRSQPSRFGGIFAAIIALLLAFTVSGIMLHVMGFDVADAYYALFIGAFGDAESILGSLVKATPLVFTGLATGIAFRAKIWNIGQEGQLFGGAMMAYWVSTLIDFPPVLFVIVIIFAGFIGGAGLGALSGLLKARFHVNEIVTTVMMNYIILYLLSYLLTSRLWMEPGEYYLQTAQVIDSARLPLLIPGSALHLGFLLAILAIVVVHLLLYGTGFGYEIRAFGLNPVASRFKGTNPKSIVILVLAISGGLAGLGGATQVFGVDFRVSHPILMYLGWTGIIIAVVAGLRPIAIGITALLFGALAQGSLFMQVMADVSSAIVTSMQAVLLILFLGSSVMSRYRIIRVR